MNFFDGHFETVHLERADAFGIPRPVYQCLAQAAISAWELANIEPVLLEPLDGRKGGICTLYGKEHVFQIRVECHFPVPVVCLDIGNLDDPSELQNVGGGDAEDFDNWRLIVSLMLKAEGFVGMSWEEFEQWNREHGFA
jgi:hypothetical protein